MYVAKNGLCKRLFFVCKTGNLEDSTLYLRKKVLPVGI
jgi:hypothetical protein